MYNVPPQSTAAASVAAYYLATMATDREPSSPSLSGLSCFFQEDDGDGDDAGGASDGASSGTQGGLQEVSVNDGGINEDVPDVSIAELESMSRNDRYEQLRAECYLDTCHGLWTCPFPREGGPPASPRRRGRAPPRGRATPTPPIIISWRRCVRRGQGPRAQVYVDSLRVSQSLTSKIRFSTQQAFQSMSQRRKVLPLSWRPYRCVFLYRIYFML